MISRGLFEHHLSAHLNQMEPGLAALLRRKVGYAWRPIIDHILGSPHNPKFLWVDDAEIVGDRITEVCPVPGNFFTQETERRISELGACCVAFVVRDVSVHETPQPLDRMSR
jgi:hypothetical protein